MDIRAIDDNSWMTPGHGLNRDEVVAAMAEFAPGVMVGRLGEAWYGDDERGFVQGHHDGATEVTVIHEGVPQ